MREFHRRVKTGRSGRRKGGVLLAVVADTLAGHIEMPGRAARRFATDNLEQRIVFVRHDGDPDFDGPVAVGHLSGHLRRGIPVKPPILLRRLIKIDNRTSRIDHDLVVRVRFGLEQNLDRIAVPQRRIVVLAGADVQRGAGSPQLKPGIFGGAFI